MISQFLFYVLILFGHLTPEKVLKDKKKIFIFFMCEGNLVGTTIVHGVFSKLQWSSQ